MIDLTSDLNKKQVETLMGYITTIEKTMSTVVDETNADSVSYCLNERIALLADCSKVMELATLLFSEAKGKASATAIMNEAIYNAKQAIQMRWFEGELSKWSALYVRAEECCKQLANQEKGLITLLSFLKSKQYENA